MSKPISTTHYIICIDKNGPLVLVVPIEEFDRKGGLTQPWGSTWKSIEAESDIEARIKAFEFYSKFFPNARLGGRGLK